MTRNTAQPAVEPVRPDREDLEQFTSYEDGDDLVIVDKETTTAWVRSDVTEPVRP